MAESKSSYPTITEQRWWTLRERFKKSLPPKVTPAYLQSILNISEKTAATVELPTLRRLGLIAKDGTPLDLAKRWRDDQQYAAVCQEIRSSVYPEELRHAAPDPVADEQSATRWFMHQGDVGERAAADMARTYRLLGLATPKQPGEKPDKKPKAKSDNDTVPKGRHTRSERVAAGGLPPRLALTPHHQ